MTNAVDFERMYRNHVAGGSTAARAPLPMLLLAATLAFVSAADALGRGDLQGAVMYPLLFLGAGSYFVMKNYPTATLWVPRARPSTFVPPRRSYLAALRRRPPAERPWESVKSAKIENFSERGRHEQLRGKPRFLRLQEQNGKRWLFEYIAYPSRFDSMCGELMRRGMLEVDSEDMGPWVPQPGIDGAPKPSVARARLVAPAQAEERLTVVDHRAARRFNTVAALFLSIMFVSLLPLAIGSATAGGTLGVYSLALQAALALLIANVARVALRSGDVVIEAGSLRMPGRQFPYRPQEVKLSEIPLMAIEPDPETEVEATTRVAKAGLDDRKRQRAQNGIALWMAVGGLLIVLPHDLRLYYVPAEVQGQAYAKWAAARQGVL